MTDVLDEGANPMRDLELGPWDVLAWDVRPN